MSETFHPQYIEASKAWEKVRLAHKGQDAIKDHGTMYLPATSGMSKSKKGMEMYNDSYKKRARFYPLTHDYVDVIIGLATENDLVIENKHGTEKITKNGLGIDMLTAECLTNTSLIGRHILIVDAVANMPYIAQYDAESFVDWAVDDFGDIIWGKFKETYDDDPDPRKRELKTRYREYYLDKGKWTVYTTDEGGGNKSEVIDLDLPIDENRKQYCPIIVLGSRNNKPDVDSIPALPIVEASIAMYQLSADLRQGLHGVAQPTAYGTGLKKEDVKAIIESGLGVGAFLSASMPEAKFGMLEMNGAGLKGISEEIEKEQTIGKDQALRIVNQGSGAETATSVAIRTNSQRATVWTMFQSVSKGIEKALTILDKWQGHPADVVFEIKAEFAQAEAEAAMLTALNTTVTAENAPRSVIYQWMRDSKLTKKTDEELDNEIAIQAPKMTLT